MTCCFLLEDDSPEISVSDLPEEFLYFFDFTLFK